MPQENNEMFFTARVMADVFMDHRDGEGDITDKGAEILKDIFGDVPEDDRADTYIAFIATLQERGFKYEVAEIQSIQ